MVGQFNVDEDGEIVYCILVDNNLDKPDSIKINENAELQHKSRDISELSILNHLNQHQKYMLVNLVGIGMMTEEVDSYWTKMWKEIGS